MGGRGRQVRVRQREEGKGLCLPLFDQFKNCNSKKKTVKQRLHVPVLIVTRHHGAQIITTLRAVTKRKTSHLTLYVNKYFGTNRRKNV